MSDGLRNLTIRQLRALAALAGGRSVTAAANKLNLTQPAVTLQLQNLQELAGLPLVQRTNDGMLLTGAGQEVLMLSERIEAAISTCATSLDMIAGRTGGRVSIGAVSTAKYFVPFAIAAFSKLHPKIDISLSIGNRQEIRQALRGYDLDFAIMGRPPADVDVDIHLIGDHPHIIIAPSGHRLALNVGLSTAELADETFLIREQGSGTRMLMEHARRFTVWPFSRTAQIIFLSVLSAMGPPVRKQTIEQRSASTEFVGLLFIPAAGTSLEGKDRRARERRR